MNEELKKFFKSEYESVEVPHELKKKILSGENRKIYVMAAVSVSAFVIFIIMMFTEFSAQFDSIINAITLP